LVLSLHCLDMLARSWQRKGVAAWATPVSL